MSANGSSTELDPLALQHAKEQIEILQRNLELLKLSQQLEQEKAKAEVEKIKAAADRQKAAMDQIKALIPTGTTKPLSGETKVDEKYGYIAKLTVNKATENVAAAIAQEIRGGLIAPGAARIALVDSLDVCGDDIQALQAAKQIEALKTTLAAQAAKIDPLLTSLRAKGQPGAEVFIAGAALIPAVAQALAAAPGALSWAADIAAFFKPEDTYKSVDVALPLTALQVNVAGALRTPDAVTTFFPNFHTFGTLTDLPILKAFRECTEARHDLSAKAAELKILVEAAKAPADNSQPEVSAQIKLADAAVAALGSLTQAFDDFSKLMTTVPEGKSYSPLARAAMREYLKGTQKASHLLYLNVISSGGEVSIRKFLWSTRGIVFLGGCVVSYLLADVDGATLASGTLGRLAQTSYKRGQDDPLRFEALGG